eukprot:242128-Rhodomonas_salina.4
MLLPGMVVKANIGDVQVAPTLSPYALAMGCPVLAECMVLREVRYWYSASICCYAMSGTRLEYATIGLRVCHAMSGTVIAYARLLYRMLLYCPMRLLCDIPRVLLPARALHYADCAPRYHPPLRYAMSGTGIAYAANVLRGC